MKLFFTASSGNLCTVRLTHHLGANASFGGAWKRMPSDADMRECDAWFPGAMSEATGRDIKLVSSVVEEDPQKADAIGRAFVSDSTRFN